MIDEEKKSFRVENMLKKFAKRGNVYEYPILIEDMSKMPKFSDTPLRYFVVQESYKKWREDPNNKKFFIPKFFIRDYEQTWAKIADEIFLEMEENHNGVKLPEQLGELYIGEPPNKTFYVLTNRPDFKHIIWRNKGKYINKFLNYFYFHTFHKRYRSAMYRNEYYKTAKEAISRYNKT